MLPPLELVAAEMNFSARTSHPLSQYCDDVCMHSVLLFLHYYYYHCLLEKKKEETFYDKNSTRNLRVQSERELALKNFYTMKSSSKD